MRENPFRYDEHPFPAPGPSPLELVVSRGATAESRHRVHALVTDRSGKREGWGNPELVVFPRSTIKLLQALPLVMEGWARKWGLGQQHLALACASHYGEKIHTSTVAEWLERLRLSDKSLECGPHQPYSEEARKELILQGRSPCRIHNNCSGKHTGMLTVCVSEGLPVAGYSDYSHPYQERQRRLLGPLFGLDLNAAAWGIDGCGIPTYAMPLTSLARGIACCAGSVENPEEVREAVRTFNEAIQAKPEYVESSESPCTQITRATAGKVIAKSGAEGVFCAWCPDSGQSLVLKVEDGSERAAEAALFLLLRRMGFRLSPLEALARVKNWAGETVGAMYFV
jgi:L-asparaginase II